MIARLEGVLIELAPTRVVIDVQGVGYEVLIPLSTFTELPDLGKVVALHVHTNARENALQLFGFLTLAERAAFELMLRANRVGPKLAQTVVSGIAPAELLAAIRGGKASVLLAVPGIGAKMAERILVELRDRGDELAAVLSAARSSDGLGELEGSLDDDTTPTSVRDQTLSALLNLGYPRAHAERVLDAACDEAGPDASIEALVRSALKRLAK